MDQLTDGIGFLIGWNYIEWLEYVYYLFSLLWFYQHELIFALTQFLNLVEIKVTSIVMVDLHFAEIP